MNQVIANGYHRLLRAPEVQAEVNSVTNEIRAKYATELADSSWLGRLAVRRRMQREIRAAVERIVSEHSLY